MKDCSEFWDFRIVRLLVVFDRFGDNVCQEWNDDRFIIISEFKLDSIVAAP